MEELKKLPGAVWVDKQGTRYRNYAEPIPPDKLKTCWFDGDPQAEGTAIYDKPKAEKGQRLGTIIGGKAVRGFFTPSGKVEFVSHWLPELKNALGRPIDPLPVYVARDWQPDDEFPLYLVNRKEASHTHSRTHNNAWLLDIKPDNPLIMHPDTTQR